METLKKQNDILNDNNQALLWAVSIKDGHKIAEYPIQDQPVFDGMIASKGKIYISTTKGNILCYGSE